MKKFFWTMCTILLAATSCQVGSDDDGSGNKGNHKKPITGTYEVGQLYDLDGVKGVVFEISSSGQHGKIVSLALSSNYMSWDDARAWSVGQGEGWYLPTLDELWVIFRNKTILNKTLEVTKGGTIIQGEYVWASTEYEYDDEYAYYFSMDSAYTGYAPKYSTNSVRAVRAF